MEGQIDWSLFGSTGSKNKLFTKLTDTKVHIFIKLANFQQVRRGIKKFQDQDCN